MKKILILVQSCNNDFFQKEIECIKKTYASNLPSNIDFIYYTGNNDKEELIDDCLKLTCSDDIYSTFRKTYYALRFLQANNIDYDYIRKTYPNFAKIPEWQIVLYQQPHTHYPILQQFDMIICTLPSINPFLYPTHHDDQSI